MTVKPVSPQNGKFTIHGKSNSNLELTLDSTELDKYIVEELSGVNMDAKLPSDNPLGIGWLACFSVYNKKNNKKSGYANVKYSFKIELAENERLFIAYNNTAHEVTDEIRNSGKVTLSEGDPAAGVVPPRPPG